MPAAIHNALSHAQTQNEHEAYLSFEDKSLRNLDRTSVTPRGSHTNTEQPINNGCHVNSTEGSNCEATATNSDPHNNAINQPCTCNEINIFGKPASFKSHTCTP